MNRTLPSRATPRAVTGFGHAMRTASWVAVTLAFGLGCGSGHSDDGAADGRSAVPRTAPVATTSPHSVTGAEFERQVVDADRPVVVEFGASWCHHCQKLGDVVQELAAGAPRTRVVTVDVDRDPELAERYDIETLPTLAVFVAGAPVGEVRGVRERAELGPLFLALDRPGSAVQVAELRAILAALGGAGVGDSCSVPGGDSRAASACELPPPCENC